MNNEYPHDENREQFFMTVATALKECQALELALKRHIGGSFEAARKYISGRIVFNLDEREFEKKSLGQLIEIYSKLTDDNQLIKDLKSFIGERNFLAHKAITESYLPDGTFSPSNSEGMHERIDAIHKTAHNLYRRVYDSGQMVLIHVWFDEITDSDGNGTERSGGESATLRTTA